MSGYFDPVFHPERLRVEAHKTRAASLLFRLEAAQTYCSAVELEVHCRRAARAQEYLLKVRKTLDEVEHRLNDPDFVSLTQIDHLHEKLDELRGRVNLLEAQLLAESSEP